jgi:hypothetical protein
MMIDKITEQAIKTDKAISNPCSLSHFNDSKRKHLSSDISNNNEQCSNFLNVKKKINLRIFLNYF